MRVLRTKRVKGSVSMEEEEERIWSDNNAKLSKIDVVSADGTDNTR